MIRDSGLQTGSAGATQIMRRESPYAMLAEPFEASGDTARDVLRVIRGGAVGVWEHEA
jgi:hypothetical protein